MSKQAGRGGMGNHKHGISGHTHNSSRQKAAMAREANAELARRKRKRKPLGAESVSQLLEENNDSTT